MTTVTAQTSKCHAFGHREFLLTYDTSAVVQPDASWLLAHLENEVAAGTAFSPGQTLRIGWMITQIAEAGHDSRLLAVNEPDFRGLPLVWVEGVTSTLAHLRAQTSAVESCEASFEISFADIRQSAVCCTGVDATGFHLERFEEGPRDSGWLIGCSKTHQHELRRISLYELACRHPFLVDFLALPSGIEVYLERGTPLQLQYRQSPVGIRAGSYLDLKYMCEDKVS